ncbi:MAG: hypothetical protein HQ569_01980 [Actinobacteria bacterium]|nr:hypothetical protein [Actinomycetota bacterium]
MDCVRGFSKPLSLIFILLSFAFAQTEVSGLINSNTTWDSTGSPYIVTGNIAVMNATLNIRPGVEVKFNQDLNMQLLSGGELIAQGIEQDSIVFTGDGNGVTWGGVFFSENAIASSFQNDTSYISGSIIDYVIFTNAGRDASEGGAINTYVDLLISNSRFEDNFINQYGGAIHCDWSKKLHVYSSKFLNNIASVYGGAISNAEFISRCSFFNNYSSGTSGAVFHCRRLKNSIFEGNTADNGGGGAVSNVDSVLNCRFINNIALSSNRNGGAIYNVKNVFNSEFINNSAQSGGAIYTYGRNLHIYNSVFISNYGSWCKFQLKSLPQRKKIPV